ncbi:MAG: cytochrome c oxidase assembly protein [Pseudomonadota bacterium]
MNNSRIALIASGVVAFMLGLAFAADPIYDTFCRVTGFGGTTQIAREAPDRVSEREVEVRFDANVADAPLLFRPIDTSFDIRLGEHGLATYEVTNTSDEPVSVIASYNVTPHEAGIYFAKLECFCFEERVIAAGETKTLPVVFFVSPDMDEERAGRSIRTITLSYTFFETGNFPGAGQTAALSPNLAGVDGGALNPRN